MAEVESFTLDHNKVIAPYVRLIANEHGKKGDVISNFDIRFLQPNKQEMPTGVVHTFEHLLADLLRDRLEGIIDISPFGCRTGFHLILWEERSPEDIARALKSTLKKSSKRFNSKIFKASLPYNAETTATTHYSVRKNTLNKS